MDANKDFLAVTLFIIDLAAQTHLQSCLVCEDHADVDVVCLHFSGAHAAVLDYTLFVNLPDFLRVTVKRPHKETMSRSIMSYIMSAPSGANKAPGEMPNHNKGPRRGC
jgi:hypothetical protein